MGRESAIHWGLFTNGYPPGLFTGDVTSGREKLYLTGNWPKVFEEVDDV